jgi:hypothetical protein
LGRQPIRVRVSPDSIYVIFLYEKEIEFQFPIWYQTRLGFSPAPHNSRHLRLGGRSLSSQPLPLGGSTLPPGGGPSSKIRPTPSSHTRWALHPAAAGLPMDLVGADFFSFGAILTLGTPPGATPTRHQVKPTPPGKPPPIAGHKPPMTRAGAGLRSRRPSTGPPPLLSHLQDADPSPGAASPPVTQIHRRRPPPGCRPPSPPASVMLLEPTATVVDAGSLATTAAARLLRPTLSLLLRPARARLPLRRRQTMRENPHRHPWPTVAHPCSQPRACRPPS